MSNQSNNYQLIMWIHYLTFVLNRKKTDWHKTTDSSNTYKIQMIFYNSVPLIVKFSAKVSEDFHQNSKVDKGNE